MKKKIVIVLIAILGGQIWAQTVTNSPDPAAPALPQAITNNLGGGKAGFPADLIGIKKGAPKFRFDGKDFDYSGNFSILLTTPRLHKNPYLGFGKPETTKLLTLGDFFKGETDGTRPCFLRIEFVCVNLCSICG
jgi:hypothetical protein